LHDLILFVFFMLTFFFLPKIWEAGLGGEGDAALAIAGGNLAQNEHTA
jgi:hypothetical protein